MGKKKSKTAKQKQAKQARKKFGVSVKQGGAKKSFHKREQQSSLLVVNGKVQQAQKHRKNTTTPIHNDRRRRSMNSLESPSPANKSDTAKHIDDFDAQMASAQERQAARESFHSNNNKKKNATRHHVFQPATLIVDDKHKSTSRLLDETTSQIHQGLHGIGSSSSLQPRSSLSLAAASGGTAWSATDTSEPCELKSNNPYAALGAGDSDDEEEQQQVALPTLPLFRLAPPSFVMGGNNNDDDDVDPDL